MAKRKKRKQAPADAAPPPGDEGEGRSGRKGKKARKEKAEAILPSQIKNKDKHRQVHADVKREKKAQKRGQAARRADEPSETHVSRTTESTQESEESVTSRMQPSPLSAEVALVFKILEQDGIAEGTDMHVHAVILCTDEQNRKAFLLLETAAGRASWIKRKWEDRMKSRGIKKF